MQSKHGSLESTILRILWNLEENGDFKNSVKDVYDSLEQSNDQKRAYTTLKTVMDRLWEKKVLSRYKEGKKFYYRTTYTNQEAIVKSLNEVCNRYCNGDFSRLSAVLNSMAVNKELLNV